MRTATCILCFLVVASSVGCNTPTPYASEPVDYTSSLPAVDPSMDTPRPTWSTPTPDPAPSTEDARIAAIAASLPDAEGPDPNLQAERRQLIAKMINEGIFRKLEFTSTLQYLWVDNSFYSLPYENKKGFVSIVYFYFFDLQKIPSGDVVVLKDFRTGKRIGQFSNYGLKMY